MNYKQYHLEPYNMINLFRYIGIPSTYYNKVFIYAHTRQFFKNLAGSVAEYGKISESQYNTAIAIIKKDIKVNGFPYSLEHIKKYEKVSGNSSNNNKKYVKHLFPNLQRVNICDLPFEDGSEIKTATIHPYNKSHIIFQPCSRYFKIPRPTELKEDIEFGTRISFIYHRTSCKGFLKEIKVLS